MFPCVCKAGAQIEDPWLSLKRLEISSPVFLSQPLH
uniref:Uncharacterized protein n=1 Tax=Anguilla anguilla TaxID=7936 RepID=A0A0E9T4C2_ANGAN